MPKLVQSFRTFVRTNSKVRVFLTLYFVLTIVGLTLSFLGFFFSFLTICLPIFGNTTCTSFGSYLLVFLNIPGYILSALLLTQPKSIAEPVTIALVSGLSLIFYYFLGTFFDQKKSKLKFRFARFAVRSSDEFVVKFILATITLLVVLFAYLLLRLRL